MGALQKTKFTWIYECFIGITGNRSLPLFGAYTNSIGFKSGVLTGLFAMLFVLLLLYTICFLQGVLGFVESSVMKLGNQGSGNMWRGNREWRMKWTLD